MLKTEEIKLSAVLFLLIFCGQAFAANLYVDPNPAGHADATWSGVNGESYTSTALGFPGTGAGYHTIKAALSAHFAGDHIYIRGGTYQEGHIRIPYDHDGSNWTDDFNLIASFPGEWAVIDGQNGGGTGGDNGIVVGGNSNSQGAIGFAVADSSNTYRMAYWKFERLEIMNGASADGQNAAGIRMHIGPVWVRYCYIHDNLASNSNNPGGVRIEQPQDCLIEYNYFKDNGALTDIGHNCAHINIFSDYIPNDIAQNGFTDPANRPALARNEIRYNYFSGGVVGVKYKQDQFFSGRETFSDSYRTYGDKVHHNIFIGQARAGIIARQDFIQIYNNITDSTSIDIGELDTRSIYKAVTYNNTLYEPAAGEVSNLFRVHRFWNDYNLPNQDTTYYGYDYNNLIYGAIDHYNTSDFGVDVAGTWAEANLDGYFGTHNYSYLPGAITTEVFRNLTTNLTVAQFEAAFSGARHFLNTSEGNPPAFVSSAGADKYKVNGSHVVETGTTLENGGVGGRHPYLSAVALPSYIGAVNPSDSDWVDGVLTNLASTTWLRSTTIERDVNDDPTWLEADPDPAPDLQGSENSSSGGCFVSSVMIL